MRTTNPYKQWWALLLVDNRCKNILTFSVRNKTEINELFSGWAKSGANGDNVMSAVVAAGDDGYGIPRTRTGGATMSFATQSFA